MKALRLKVCLSIDAFCFKPGKWNFHCGRELHEGWAWAIPFVHVGSYGGFKIVSERACSTSVMGLTNCRLMQSGIRNAICSDLLRSIRIYWCDLTPEYLWKRPTGGLGMSHVSSFATLQSLFSEWYSTAPRTYFRKSSLHSWTHKNHFLEFFITSRQARSFFPTRPVFLPLRRLEKRDSMSRF